MKSIKLYGAQRCHKTKHYQTFLDKIGFSYEFLDVEQNENHAEELSDLYKNRMLNFPTITIGKKKLRNPSDKELNKWIDKLFPKKMKIQHDIKNNRFTLDFDEEIAFIDYQLQNNTMHLIHSQVPYNLRGQGIGKVLVEKTFEQLIKEGYKAIAICSYIKDVASKSDMWKTIIEH